MWNRLQQPRNSVPFLVALWMFERGLDVMGWESTGVATLLFGVAALAFLVFLVNVLIGSPEERAARSQLKLWSHPPIRRTEQPLREHIEAIVIHPKIRRAAFVSVMLVAWGMIGYATFGDHDAWMGVAFGWIFLSGGVMGWIEGKFGLKAQERRAMGKK